MFTTDHKINHAVLAIINDGNGSLCGLTYTRRCELAEYGLVDYCHAVKQFDPTLTRTQNRKAGEILQAYYQNHVAEMNRIEREQS